MPTNSGMLPNRWAIHKPRRNSNSPCSSPLPLFQITSLTITKRIVSTARLMQQHRQNSTDSYSSSSLTRSGTTASSLSRSGTIPSKAVPPPTSPSYGSSTGAAPPPYQAAAATVGSAVGAGAVGKRPPPPPPPAKPKPKPAVTYVTALYDYAAQVRFALSLFI